MIHDFAKHTHRCHVSGQPIKPGETYFSALVDTPSGQERWDFSEQAWTGPPEGTIGYWKGKLPEEAALPPKPKEVPVEVLLAAFDRLSTLAATDPADAELRYVLTLMLVRKRALKLHSMRREGEHDTLVVRRPPSQETIDVPDPGIEEAQLPIVEGRLHEWLEAAIATGEV